MSKQSLERNKSWALQNYDPKNIITEHVLGYKPITSNRATGFKSSFYKTSRGLKQIIKN